VRLVYPAAFSETDMDLGIATTASRAVVEGAAQPLIDENIVKTMTSHIDSIGESVLEAASLALVLATKGQYTPREPEHETKLPGEAREIYDGALKLRAQLQDYTEGLLEVSGQ
jgi:hypothetical protein